jgi:hypothetical protein
LHSIAPDSQPYYNGLTVIYGLVEKEQLDQETLAFPVPCMILGAEGSFGIIPVDSASSRLRFFTGLQLPDRPMEDWQAFWKDTIGLKALLTGSFGQESWPKTVQVLCRDTLDDEVSAWL